MLSYRVLFMAIWVGWLLIFPIIVVKEIGFFHGASAFFIWISLSYFSGNPNPCKSHYMLKEKKQERVDFCDMIMFWTNNQIGPIVQKKIK